MQQESPYVDDRAAARASAGGAAARLLVPWWIDDGIGRLVRRRRAGETSFDVLTLGEAYVGGVAIALEELGLGD